jgi:hypothetical protein
MVGKRMVFLQQSLYISLAYLSPSEVIMIDTNEFPLRLSDIETMNKFPGGDVEFELSKAQMKQLNPEAKEMLIRDRIRRVIRKLGEDGLSISEIIKITNFDRKTIVGHLQTLEALREVYSQKKNEKMTLYYPNGKPLHQLGSKRISWDNSIFEIYIAQGQKNKLFYYILEKKWSIIEGEVSEGAILLPLEGLEEFTETLKKFKNEFQGANP